MRYNEYNDDDDDDDDERNTSEGAERATLCVSSETIPSLFCHNRCKRNTLNVTKKNTQRTAYDIAYSMLVYTTAQQVLKCTESEYGNLVTEYL